MPNSSDLPTTKQTPSSMSGCATGPATSRTNPKNEIGTSASETGSMRRLPSSSPLDAALQGSSPVETMRALEASLPRSVNFSMTMECNTVGDFLKWRLRYAVPDQDLSSALALAKQSLSPMTRNERLKLLTETFIRTAPRQQSTDDLKLRLGVYESDLAEFPADIVRYVLQEWPKNNMFWPTMKELYDRLNFWMVRRAGIVRVLENAMKPPVSTPI